MDESEQESIRKNAQHVLRVKALFPGIKSALFLPMWNFERNRWFAGCFCWSTRAERNLSGSLDLPFVKAFSHSIMQEVARFDAHKTSQVKTTFLSSLSHELRSPLVRSPFVQTICEVRPNSATPSLARYPRLCTTDAEYVSR